jgi:hypothetical protein
MLKIIILAILLLIGIPQPVLADELTHAKYNDIKTLIEITNSTQIGMQLAAFISQQLFQVLKQSNPEIPDRAIIIMQEELSTIFSEKFSTPGGLIDQIIPIYDKYFTHQEILDLLTFYATPTGKKTISVLPIVLNESMMAGQRWGESLNSEIEIRLKSALIREGFLPDHL